MPLTYIALTLMSYFGPNAKLLGNIQLEIWQYQSMIKDIEGFVLRVGLLQIVDTLSFFINGILFWYLCGINLLRIMNKLQQRFWMVFAIAEALFSMMVGNQMNGDFKVLFCKS